VPKVNCDFLVIEQASYDDDFRNEAWGKGYKVVVWTVDEEDQIRGLVIDNINGIITDQPKIAVQARDAIETEQGLTARLGDMLTRSSSF
jgi:glycerophosphoryl diester phosphodiesterase